MLRAGPVVPCARCYWYAHAVTTPVPALLFDLPPFAGAIRLVLSDPGGRRVRLPFPCVL